MRALLFGILGFVISFGLIFHWKVTGELERKIVNITEQRDRFEKQAKETRIVCVGQAIQLKVGKPVSSGDGYSKTIIAFTGEAGGNIGRDDEERIVSEAKYLSSIVCSHGG